MQLRKALLLIIITLIIFPANVAASTNKPPVAGLFFAETVKLSDNNARVVNIFLISEAEIATQKGGIIISIGGDVTVINNYSGTVLPLFSEITAYSPVKYGIIELKYIGLIVKLLLGFIFIRFFGAFSKGTVLYFESNMQSVAKFGIYGYLMSILLLGTFFISVSGTLFAMCGVIILLIVSYVGHIPVSLFIGQKIAVRIGKEINTYGCFFIGIIILHVLRAFPYIGTCIAHFIMPTLSLGIFSVYIIHRYFYKEYPSVILAQKNDNNFDREKIRSIIMNNIDSKGDTAK